jgi:hypothetical protein
LGRKLLLLPLPPLDTPTVVVVSDDRGYPIVIAFPPSYLVVAHARREQESDGRAHLQQVIPIEITATHEVYVELAPPAAATVVVIDVHD